MTQTINMQAIGVMRTPFGQKFGIPRQPNLVAAEGRLQLLAPFRRAEALAGLEQASHVWVLWQFHACPEKEPEAWSPTVRPPRLGGEERIGVFASRSGFRPNRIGMSVCELISVNADASLSLRGVDMLDGTPVLDIKPYLPYADQVPEARLDWAPAPEKQLPVRWEEARSVVELTAKTRDLIETVLAQDPRPLYLAPEREYGFSLAGYEVRFRVRNDCAWVMSVKVE